MASLGMHHPVAAPAAPLNVLFVSCSPEPRLSAGLESAGVRVISVPTAGEALGRLDSEPPACVVIDMDAADAELVLRHLEGRVPPGRVAVLASASSLFVAMTCWAARRAHHVLMKPLVLDELLPLLAGTGRSSPRLPSVERLQWEYIHAVLGSCNGNVSEAARQLGMYRQSLQRMLRRHPPRH